jgi:hypothetical protein
LLLLALLGYTAKLPTLEAYTRVHNAGHVLWPSSILLLATAGSEHTLGGYLTLGVSIAVNMALYAIVGFMLSVFRRSGKGPHDLTSKTPAG